MLDFQTLLQTLEEAAFSHTQWDQLRQVIDKRDHSQSNAISAISKPFLDKTALIPQNSPEWFSGLTSAIDQFWEGVSEEDKAELIAAWNRS